MAKKKPANKSTFAVSDTSGSNLADFKNILTKTANVVQAGNKVASNFIDEITGAAAIERAIDNPSKKSIASAALSVGSFFLPVGKLAKAASIAGRASEIAAANALARSRPVIQAALSKTNVTKSMALKGGLGSLHNAGHISQILGSKVTTVGPKNVSAVIRGVEMNARNKGAAAAANSLTQSASQAKGLAAVPVAVAVNNMLNSQPQKNKNKNQTKK